MSHRYAPVVDAVTRRTKEGNLVVEIGPGTAGIPTLAELRNRGRLVGALEPAIMIGGPPQIRQGRWEEIAKWFEAVDLIYTVYMHPLPLLDGPFDTGILPSAYAKGPNEQEQKAMQVFERHIAKNMHVVLNPGGSYVNIHREGFPEYRVNYPEIFVEQGLQLQREIRGEFTLDFYVRTSEDE